MNKLKLTLILFFVAIGLTISGCKDNEPIVEKTPVMTMDTLSFDIKKGDEFELKPVITDGSDDLIILFSSEDANIASVNNQGLVKGIAVGTVIITVSLEKYPEVFLQVIVNVALNESDVINEIILWAKDVVGNRFIQNVSFPSKHPNYDSEITWTSSNEDLLSSDGYIYQQEYDQTFNLTLNVKYNGITETETYEATVLGYATELVATSFLNQFSSFITRDYLTIKTTDNGYPNAVITWYSSNTDIFTNQGLYLKPNRDMSLTIYVTVTFPSMGVSRTYSKDVTVKGDSIYDKISKIEQDVLNQLNINKIVKDSLELPSYHQEFGANLKWSSNKPLIVSQTGAISKPSINQMVTLRCEVTIGSDTSSFKIEFEVASNTYDEKWEAVDNLLSTIFIPQIPTQKYQMFGVTFDYFAFNYGYIPFYTNTPSPVIQALLTKQRSVRTETRWVVIHDTANTNPTADAEMHSRWIQTEPGVSWHFTVDDRNIYQHLPTNRTAAHAGASEGNNYGIGIETCINQGVDYNQVMRKTAKLTSELMKEYNLTIYNVRQHNFFSGKDCPHVMRASNRWNEFLDLVAMEYFALNELQGVEFVWQSLTPSILDNTGRIFNHPGHEVDVSFKVTVTYNGVTKEYTHIAKLLPPSWL